MRGLTVVAVASALSLLLPLASGATVNAAGGDVASGSAVCAWDRARLAALTVAVVAPPPAVGPAHAQAVADAVEAWERIMDRHVFPVGFTVLPAERVRSADVLVQFVPTMTSVAGLATLGCGKSAGGPEKVLLSTWFVASFTPTDTYNVMLHEFGHVLGLDHVVRPTTDVMHGDYDYPVGGSDTPRLCASNLNAATLARAASGNLAPVAMPAASYRLLC